MWIWCIEKILLYIIIIIIIIIIVVVVVVVVVEQTLYVYLVKLHNLNTYVKDKRER